MSLNRSTKNKPNYRFGRKGAKSSAKKLFTAVNTTSDVTTAESSTEVIPGYVIFNDL